VIVNFFAKNEFLKNYLRIFSLSNVSAMFSNQNLPKSSHKFYCKFCDYGTSKKSSYNDHVLSTKHQKLVISNQKEQNGNEHSQILPKFCQPYICPNCSKEYKDNSGLWRHKKKCIKLVEEMQEKKQDDSVSNETVLALIKQNQELQKQDYSVSNENVLALIKQNQELQKQVFELASKPNTINNNTNNTMNASFNLNLFLNETCKDAMNLTDFVDSLKISFADLENTGKLGYEKGISQIFLNGLKELDVSRRPIHCTDSKRENLYIKDKDNWQKDQEKDRIRMAVRKVANKNVNQIADWFNANPDAHDYHSKKNDQYLNIVLKATGGSTKEEEEKRINKVITTIARHVEIDKKDLPSV